MVAISGAQGQGRARTTDMDEGRRAKSRKCRDSTAHFSSKNGHFCITASEKLLNSASPALDFAAHHIHQSYRSVEKSNLNAVRTFTFTVLTCFCAGRRRGLSISRAL